MADPLDILYNRPSRDGGDEFGATLANIAQMVLSIPERRAEMESRRAAIEAQQMNAQANMARTQIQQDEAAQKQAMQQRMAEMNEAVNQIVAGAMVPAPDGTKRLDRARIAEGFAKAGVPLEMQKKTFDSLDSVDESLSKFEKARQEHAADVLNAVLENGGGADAAMLGIAYGKANGWLKDQDIEPIYQLLASDRDPRPVIKQLRDSLSDKYRKKPAEPKVVGDALVTTEGDVLYQAPVKPSNPTEASLAMQAAGGDAGKALGLMNQPAPMSAYQAEQLKLARAREAREAAKPAGADKPPTGAQDKALGFFNRAKNAEDNLEQIDKQIASLGYLGQAWLKAPNVLKTEVGQLYEQARRSFAEAILRRDSGATIKDSEYADLDKTYFVQPGDSDAVIAQKRRSRAEALAAIGVAAGPALTNYYGDDSLIGEYRSRAAQQKQPSSNPFRKSK